MFTFAWPFMGALLLLPFLVRFFAPAVKQKPELSMLRFPYLGILEKTFSAHVPQGQRFGWVFAALLFMAWLCIVLALMRPQFVDQLTEVDNKGYDIMLAVDLSGSMRALDFSTKTQRVNRLDVAKKVVGDFVNDRRNDRIGLVLFGDSAYQYAPLTLDTKSVSQMLNETVISMAGDGTAIGDAIGMSVKGLRDRPEKSRIIILLTDGSDTASSIPPKQATQLAKDYGIKIYTIGIGSHGDVPYPDQYGRVMMVQMDMDENLLKEIAAITGGAYFYAADANALRDIYSNINEIEKTEVETREYLIRTPLYRYPLGVGLCLFLLVSLLPFVQGRGDYGF